jgi:predicted RNA-binding Zn-ribbon protein involved in translation (DUF1610 family)
MKSFYEVRCACGQLHQLDADASRWTCQQCGRRSIIDFAARYTERELRELLNQLDTRRDQLARALEIRRQRIGRVA